MLMHALKTDLRRMLLDFGLPGKSVNIHEVLALKEVIARLEKFEKVPLRREEAQMLVSFRSLLGERSCSV